MKKGKGKPGEAGRFTVWISRVRYTAYKRGRRWWVRWQLGGLKRRALNVENRRDAEEAIHESLAPPAAAPANVSRLPIKDAIAMFLDHRKTVKRNAPKTVQKYKTVTDAFLAHCNTKGLEFMDQITECQNACA